MNTWLLDSHHTKRHLQLLAEAKDRITITHNQIQPLPVELCQYPDCGSLAVEQLDNGTLVCEYHADTAEVTQ